MHGRFLDVSSSLPPIHSTASCAFQDGIAGSTSMTSRCAPSNSFRRRRRNSSAVSTARSAPNVPAGDSRWPQALLTVKNLPERTVSPTERFAPTLGSRNPPMGLKAPCLMHQLLWARHSRPFRLALELPRMAARDHDLSRPSGRSLPRHPSVSS